MAGTLRFTVTKAKINWSTFFQDSFRRGMQGSQQFRNYSGQGPSVVVQNATGEKRVLEVTKTAKEARDRVTEIEKDFQTLNASQWCERYGVPMSFVSGDPDHPLGGAPEG
jgi:hypothetical protein